MKKIVLLFILFFLFGKGYAQEPPKAEDMFKEGLRYSAQKNYSEAIKFFNEAISICKDSSKYFTERGRANLGLLKYNDAYADYTDAIRLKNNNTEAYLLRADLLLIAQKGYESIKDANMAIMLTPYDSVKKAGYINNGVARTNMRDFQGAFADLQKALTFDSIDPIIFTDMGTVYDEMKDTSNAIKFNMKAYKIDTNFLPALSNIGFIRSKYGNYKGALVTFNRILKRQPDMAFVLNNRGYVKMKLGDNKGALADINQSLKLNATNSYAFKNRALVYIQLKKMKQVCDDLQKAKDLNYLMMYGSEVDNLLLMYCK